MSARSASVFVLPIVILLVTLTMIPLARPLGPLLNALPRLLTPGSVFVDVGANVGFLSILAARLVGPEGRVIAFEPHPGAVERLRLGVAANGVGGTVEVTAAACGAQDGGTIRLHLAGDSVLSSTDPERAPLRDHFPFLRSIESHSPPEADALVVRIAEERKILHGIGIAC